MILRLILGKLTERSSVCPNYTEAVHEVSIYIFFRIPFHRHIRLLSLESLLSNPLSLFVVHRLSLIFFFSFLPSILGA